MDFTVNYNFSADLNRFDDSLNKADSSVRRLDARVKVLNETMTKTSRARPLSGITSTKLNTIGMGFQHLGNAVTTVAKKMALLTTLSGAAVLKMAKVGITFEKNFANVAKVLDDGTKVMNSRLMELREELMTLSKSFPIPTESLLNIASIAGQMGIAVQNIKPFTEWMAKLTIATNITADAGTELVSKFFNNMNLAPNTKNLKEFTNVITALGNNMAGREAGILKIAQMISQQANLLKISVKDTLALASSFNALNIRPEVARTFFQKTTDAIDEMVAHGGRELSKFTEMMGTTNQKFKALWKDDPFKGYTAFVKRFSKMTNTEITDTYKKFFNSNIRNIATIKQVAVAYRQLELAQEIANKATGNTVAINNELARRFDTVASKLILVRNNMEAVSTHIYQVFEPTIKTSLDSVINLLDRLDKAIQKNTTVIDSFVINFGAGLKAPFKVVGGLIDTLLNKFKEWRDLMIMFEGENYESIAGKIGNSIGKVVAMIPLLFAGGKAIKGLGTAFKLLAGASRVIGVGPTLAIAGIVTALGLAIAKNKEFRGKFNDMFKFLASKKDDIAKWIEEFSTAVEPVLKPIFDLLNKLADYIGEHKDDIIGFFNEVKKFVEEVAPIIGQVLTKLKDGFIALLPVVTLLGWIINGLWEAFKGVAGFIWSILSPILDALLETFKGLAGTIGGAVDWVNRFNKACEDNDMEEVEKLINEAWDNIGRHIDDAVQDIIDDIGKIPDKVMKDFNKIPGIIEDALKGVPGIIDKFITIDLSNAITDIVDSLTRTGGRPAKMSVAGVTEIIHTVRAEPFNSGVFTDFPNNGGTNNYTFNVHTKTATNASDLTKIKQKRNMITD